MRRDDEEQDDTVGEVLPRSTIEHLAIVWRNLSAKHGVLLLDGTATKAFYQQHAKLGNLLKGGKCLSVPLLGRIYLNANPKEKK